MSHITRTWLVTPPEGFAHPKTKVLLLAGRRRSISLLVRKVNVSGQMRIIARGPSEDLAAFSGDLFHKQRDEHWHSSELPATKEDESELIGGGKHIARSSAEVAGGSDSSGQEREQPLSVDTGSVDTGSSASSRIITEEVRKERQRMEALMEAAAVREAAAREAAVAAVREAAAREATAAIEAAVREAAAREAAAAAVREAAAREAAAVARETAAVRDREAAAAAAREAAAREAAAIAREAAARETFITAFMTHASMTRAEAEKVMRNEQ